MDDQQILSLYWQRLESAISATAQKYGRYLTSIAHNILASREDSEECVNDTYLAAWNTIPPQRPVPLSLYLGKITRQKAIDRWRRSSARKRRDAQYDLALSELEDCLSAGDTTQQGAELHRLGEVLDRWLEGLTPEQRTLFLCRYFYMDAIGEIAARRGLSQSKVKTTLYRCRLSLRDYLEQEGITL